MKYSSVFDGFVVFDVEVKLFIDDYQYQFEPVTIWYDLEAMNRIMFFVLASFTYILTNFPCFVEIDE